MIKSNYRDKVFLLLVVALFLVFIISDRIIAGGISTEDSLLIDKVNSEMRAGNFENLALALDKVYIGHLSLLFKDVNQGQLLKAWDALEIKTSSGIDLDKTNKYRGSLLVGLDAAAGLNNNGKALDSFIGELIKKNSNLKDFKFVGSKTSGQITVDGNFINLKDVSRKDHKIPLKDLSGFKKMVFSEMKSGGEGYAVHYIPDKGTGSAMILSSGYLTGDKTKGYEVMDLVGTETKSVGHVNFGDNPSGAVYFRGTPKDVDKTKFGTGDYIFHKTGRAGDISFKDESGVLSSSDRDVANKNGERVGYQSENGVRGVKKLDGNGDSTPDKIIDIAHQNGIGIKYNDKIVGAGSDKKIEIIDKGNDLEVIFPKEIINAQIINNNGKVLTKDENSKQISVGKGEPMKFVNGKINGVLVGRQDSDAGSDSGRVTGSRGITPRGRSLPPESDKPTPITPGTDVESRVAPPKQDPSAGVIKEILEGNKVILTPPAQREDANAGESKKITPEEATHNAIVQARGANLELDAEMSRLAKDYSQAMGSRGRLVHSSMGYAENIAMFTSFQALSPEQVGQKFTNMWMNSRGHRQNIMSGHSREGIGIYVSQNGGQYTYWATQIFR
ncbi:hypothetical protein J4218_06230 [Candidatus Pacearchaeota archaeon]|nr:hypothetical protein [Candidatus Pacearchaeota archaeon]